MDTFFCGPVLSVEEKSGVRITTLISLISAGVEIGHPPWLVSILKGQHMILKHHIYGARPSERQIGEIWKAQRGAHDPRPHPFVTSLEILPQRMLLRSSIRT
jgi:hypothetical protein